MFTLEAALAVALLASPSPPAASGWAEVLQPSLAAIAVDAQVADESYADYLGFAELHRRYRRGLELPTLEERARFPSAETTRACISFNEAHQHDFRKRLEIDAVHETELRLALRDIERALEVWNALLMAHQADCDYYDDEGDEGAYLDKDVLGRREALQTLRELLGDRDFYAGIMPPHAPHFGR